MIQQLRLAKWLPVPRVGPSVLTFVALLCSGYVYSQESVTVTGKVISKEDSKPIPGVNIMIKGTATGTVTDVNGNYTLDAPGDATLVFSFIGFGREEIPVNSRAVIDLSMGPEMQALEEVVVTGYSTQRKKDITGSVGVVDMNALTSIPAGSAAQSLQGQAAGVTVITSGMAGYRPASAASARSVTVIPSY